MHASGDAGGAGLGFVVAGGRGPASRRKRNVCGHTCASHAASRSGRGGGTGGCTAGAWLPQLLVLPYHTLQLRAAVLWIQKRARQRKE